MKRVGLAVVSEHVPKRRPPAARAEQIGDLHESRAFVEPVKCGSTHTQVEGFRSDDVRLFDWDVWRIGRGADDLAYVMGIHWYSDRRRRLEGPLLDGYHDGLLAHGMSGYDRASLALDCRLATLRMIIWPVSQAVADVPPVI